MQRRQLSRLNYAALHFKGEKMDKTSEDQRKEKHTNILETKMAEYDALELENEALKLEEKLSRLRLEVLERQALVHEMKMKSKPVSEDYEPTLKSLAGDSALNSALDTLKQAHLQDILDTNPVMEAPTPSSSQGRSNIPVLYITDFVSKPTSAGKEEEKEIAKGLWLK